MIRKVNRHLLESGMHAIGITFNDFALQDYQQQRWSWQFG